MHFNRLHQKNKEIALNVIAHCIAVPDANQHRKEETQTQRKENTPSGS